MNSWTTTDNKVLLLPSRYLSVDYSLNILLLEANLLKVRKLKNEESNKQKLVTEETRR
jgi:hypothetical protein